MRQLENGDFLRIYSGKVNVTEDGRPCIKWSQVAQGKLYSQTEGRFFFKKKEEKFGIFPKI